MWQRYSEALRKHESKLMLVGVEPVVRVQRRIDTMQGRPKLAPLSYNESSTHSFDERSIEINAPETALQGKHTGVVG